VTQKESKKRINLKKVEDDDDQAIA